MKPFLPFKIQIPTVAGASIEFEVRPAAHGIFEIWKDDKLRCVALKDNQTWTQQSPDIGIVDFEKLTAAIDKYLEGTWPVL